MDANHRPPNDRRPITDRSDSAASDDPQAEGGRRRGNRHHAFRRKNRARQGARADDSRARTSAEMRDARASGRTPGTSTADEPAAAPLGTDDEAAGTPPRAAALEQEIDRAEQGRGMQGLDAADAMSGRPGHPEESPRAFGKLVTIAAAVVILVVLAVLYF